MRVRANPGPVRAIDGLGIARRKLAERNQFFLYAGRGTLLVGPHLLAVERCHIVHELRG